MSEELESWNQYREEQKERRKKRLPVATDEIASLKECGFIVEEKTPYQFRINGLIDIYPIHRRYHVLKTGRRGNYNYGKLKQVVRNNINQSV